MQASLFEGIEQNEIYIGKSAVKSPVFYRDLTFDAYIFACDKRGATARPCTRVFADQAAVRQVLSALLCLERRDTDLGAYNEVALCLPLAGFWPTPASPTG